ncbi:MAG: hypothetical protein F4171_15690 [Gammaproteobacteria bacterium]|nr:hypothetical protein [Gammaproteobacteria bacterium]MYG14214.1 hypothetical protein [Gammaproteobacteria bacterium]MYK37580.1 hypothetical protein [Gammaproteobacteria bacterium]
MSQDDITREELVEIALFRLPRPYTPEVTLHVFCEIERTPRLLRAYERLTGEYGKNQLNQWIGQAVKDMLGAESSGQMDYVADVCEIVKWPSRLVNIDPDIQSAKKLLKLVG